MAVKEYIFKELELFNETQLEQVKEYIKFLKFRSYFSSLQVDENEIGKLYSKYAEEDKLLAEDGMNDYIDNLIKEDRL